MGEDEYFLQRCFTPKRGDTPPNVAPEDAPPEKDELSLVDMAEPSVPLGLLRVCKARSAVGGSSNLAWSGHSQVAYSRCLSWVYAGAAGCWPASAFDRLIPAKEDLVVLIMMYLVLQHELRVYDAWSSA